MKTNITIFTDGSSRGNPGPGGWGAILISNIKNQISNIEFQGSGEIVVELGGREDHTTNNRMEMSASIEALKKVDAIFGDNADKKSGTENIHEIVLNTDSSYLINGITKWVHGWRRNNWITSQKKDVENRDLWEKLLEVSSGKKISWKYVGGHVGVVGNERCDEIATSFADNNPTELYSGPFSGYKIKNILDVSHNESVSQNKKSSSTRSKAKAYSYVSAVNGDVKIHATWAECEKRVKGVKGARFKKALDAGEESEIINQFRK
jgi:ribonuclease HI